MLYGCEQPDSFFIYDRKINFAEFYRGNPRKIYYRNRRTELAVEFRMSNMDEQLASRLFRLLIRKVARAIAGVERQCSRDFFLFKSRSYLRRPCFEARRQLDHDPLRSGLFDFVEI